MWQTENNGRVEQRIKQKNKKKEPKGKRKKKYNKMKSLLRDSIIYNLPKPPQAARHIAENLQVLQQKDKLV